MTLKPTFSLLTGALLAVAATGIAFETQPAVAQQAAEEIGEIVVEAPAAIKDRRVWVGKERRTMWEAKRSIDYADLDLRLHKDVTELEMRIEAAAKAVCKELADIKPRLSEPEPKCIRNAIASTREQLQKAVGAAS